MAVSLMFTGTLFPYQAEGVQALLSRRRLLVAYSMGTGKTVMTIAALEEMVGSGKISCCLLLVPASLRWQWAASFARFTDMPTRRLPLRNGAVLEVPTESVCMVIDGSPAQRRRQWRAAAHADYVIASHGAVLTDWADITALPVDAMVLDEATAIKNFRAETTKRIKRLRPPVRVALAGAPVENAADEIYSIMQWVDPAVLGRWDLFEKSFIERTAFGGVSRYKNLGLLHQKLAPAMIRKSRLDPEVARYLPRVTEATRLVTLDPTTRTIYKAILADLQAALEELAEAGGSFDLAAHYAGLPGAAGGGPRGKVMARLQAARMLLDHPQLLMDSACDHHASRGGSAYAAAFAASRYDLPDFYHSPKLSALDELTEVMLADGAKVAVFTEYRRMLPYVCERLDRHGGLVTFHGGMGATEKAAAKARFQQDPGCRIFISTNSGGYGLDLPEAQYLINYDLPYSNGLLQQRNTRHVRASSTHARVYVMNLVVSGTIEERVLATLKARGSVADAIVDGKGTGALDMSVESLGEHIGRSG
ncbi:DEAD/DEAH box helicase [Streptomyces roseifaciens]